MVRRRSPACQASAVRPLKACNALRDQDSSRTRRRTYVGCGRGTVECTSHCALPTNVSQTASTIPAACNRKESKPVSSRCVRPQSEGLFSSFPCRSRVWQRQVQFVAGAHS